MSKSVKVLLVVMLLVSGFALSRLSATGDRTHAIQVAIRDSDYSGSQR